ncbi:undecaprenyl-phosphate glucose phosphotransferase [Pontibacter harenae]|uniref:undecaprenyl-phosphate glucose phosphotransferase n=1 Tax=Pontibacter harenae TaxID=2894083 RepID=UPI001E4B33B3|nr:undecaprenyl-phosphate glucose phosphotransferase [Pontibacter harenae]MCC9166167.1 undecaprenyl-phosphate glucose phosphotransferase [Pontibacter harenae]
MENPGADFLAVSDFYKLYFVLLNLLWFYCSSVARLYENVMRQNALHLLRRCFGAFALYLTVSLTLAFILPQVKFSSHFVEVSSLSFCVGLLLWKLSFLVLRKYKRRFWMQSKRVVVVGSGHVGSEIYNYISTNPGLGYQVEGLFDEELSLKSEGGKAGGGIGQFFDSIAATGVSEIFCALPRQHLDKIKTLMEEADRRMVRFRLVPDVDGFFDRNVVLDLYGHMPVLTHRREPLDNKANEVVKRFFDISFSLLVIVCLLSWLIPVLALIIKLDSRGPVFFRQLRSGKNNRPFYCYKFRSMTVNTDSDSVQATKGDMRITRVGAILRKTSLDELPQFFNVLMGEMSVVGPRPHMLKHTQDYSALINNFMVRHFLTPGITGWAQVSGYRGETKETTAMSQRVEADIWYLENWSLLLDLKIIVLTVWQALRGSDKAF